MLIVRYEWWIARIRNDGEFHLPIEALPAPLPEFRSALKRHARAEGIPLRTSARYDMFLAWNPEYAAEAQHPQSSME